MHTYVAVHEHPFGQTTYVFHTTEVFPVELMDGQIDRLAEMLGIEFDPERESISVTLEDESVSLIPSDMEYILTGNRSE